MCVRLFESLNPIEGSYKDGVLTYYFDNEEHSIRVREKCSLEFKRQCTMFVNIKVFAYLYNDDYKLILWRNGLGSILTKQNVVLSTFWWNISRVKHKSYIDKLGGTVLNKTTGLYHQVTCGNLGGCYYISVEGLPISKVIDATDKNIKYNTYITKEVGIGVLNMKLVGDDLKMLTTDEVFIPNVLHADCSVIL